MSQSPDDNGQPRSGQPNGQPRTDGRRATDPVADFQRWLMRAGARSMANQVADQVRRTIGQERRTHGDVWDAATNEPPPEESPECQWCPVCQAARAARLGGPGLISSLGNAGGALASMAQDAFSAFEQIMKTQDQNRSAERTGSARPQQTRPAPPASSGSSWSVATAPQTPAPPASSAPPPTQAGPGHPGSADPEGEVGPETSP